MFESATNGPLPMSPGGVLVGQLSYRYCAASSAMPNHWLRGMIGKKSALPGKKGRAKETVPFPRDVTWAWHFAPGGGSTYKCWGLGTPAEPRAFAKGSEVHKRVTV